MFVCQNEQIESEVCQFSVILKGLNSVKWPEKDTNKNQN
jgi:hypothetical protein